MPISIRDVAARAGVSVGTVSKVLNGGAAGQIAPATQERVRQAAQALAYAPNMLAQALVRGRSGIIGILLMDGMVSPLHIAYFAALFDAILQTAAERGLNVLVITGSRWQNCETSLPTLQNTPCDGYLVFHQPEETDLFSSLLSVDIPFVVMSQTPADPRVNVVEVDNLAGGRLAAEHLWSLGHRRIALLTLGQNNRFERERIAGFLETWAAQGVGSEAVSFLDPKGIDWNSCAAILEPLTVAAPDRPTALFCLNDYLASVAVSFLDFRGVRVPKEIAVMGFDGLPSAAEGPIPLTTLAQPFSDIAGEALDLLLRQMKAGTPLGQRIQLPASLVVRQSTDSS